MFSRLQSAGLVALAIAVLSSTLYLTSYFMPQWDLPIWPIMWFSSPFTYATAIWFRDALESPSPALLALLLLMPYPIYGAVVGYAWPVASGSIAVVVRSLLRRILAIFVAAVVVALCMASWIMAGS